MGPTSPDLSVVITAHAEGRLAHRSVRSARRAISHARGQGLEVELIAVLDDPSAATLSYFEEQRGGFDVVDRVEFQDPGLSRNHGVELSSGRYVAFMDAGDLFSENWLAEAIRFAAAHATELPVLHPELNVYFGAELFLSASLNSDSPGYSPLELMQYNPWTAMCVVARDFFRGGNRYVATKGSGFAHEDWHWNCETIAGGATHRLVPGTVHFIRLGADESRPGAGRPGATFPPSKLFDDPVGGGGLVPASGAPSAGGAVGADGGTLPPYLRRPLSFAFQGIRTATIKAASGRPALLELFVELNRAGRKFLASGPRKSVDPDWLIAEWRRIHEIEPELFPSSSILKGLDSRATPRSAVARHYPELSARVGPAPTHIYLLPWLKRGGADIEAIHFMTAALRESGGGSVVCITTEDVDSEWLFMLPPEIRAVELGKLLRGFSEDEKALLLLRLLVQKKPGVIHNLNSALCYKLYRESGPALTARSKLFASIFGLEPMGEGRAGGYGIWDLPLCIDHLSGAFTDSQWFADLLCGIYGFEKEKFSVLYVPSPAISGGRRRGPESGVLNILWASRLDVEKRPDVLLRIASEASGLPVHFHVYGMPVYSSSMAGFIEKLGRLPNVTTYGAYDKFESIPASRYELYLYTSERDGLPNVLLEAAAAGLPIIAPDVGGIKELINESTGFLVSHAEAVDEYVGYIKRIQGDYHLAMRRAESAKSLIASRHSWASFVQRLSQVPGYLAPQRRSE